MVERLTRWLQGRQVSGSIPGLTLNYHHVAAVGKLLTLYCLGGVLVKYYFSEMAQKYSHSHKYVVLLVKTSTLRQ